MKNQAYFAVSPSEGGMAKIAMIMAVHPMKAHSIQGRALPMRV